MQLEIKRIAENESGTFGVIIYKDIPFALTIERQYLDNKPNISCIPPGKYVCKRVNSPRFGDTFEITDVPNRTHILFHKGNLMEDSLGCILLGERFDYLNNKPAVLSSKDAFQEFKEITKNVDEFLLGIHDYTHKRLNINEKQRIK